MKLHKLIVVPSVIGTVVASMALLIYVSKSMLFRVPKLLSDAEEAVRAMPALSVEIPSFSVGQVIVEPMKKFPRLNPRPPVATEMVCGEWEELESGHGSVKRCEIIKKKR